MEGNSGMSNLDDFLGGSSGGGGVPLGTLVEVQANTPQITQADGTEYKKIAENLVLSKADYSELLAIVGELADAAPFVAPSAPLQAATELTLTTKTGAVPLTGTFNGFHKISDTAWLLHVGSYWYISTTGPTGEYTQFPEVMGFSSHVPPHRAGAYHNGYFVTAYFLNDRNAIHVNTVQDDFTVFTEIWPQSATYDTDDYIHFCEYVHDRWIVGYSLNGFYASSTMYLTYCLGTDDPSNSANWSNAINIGTAASQNYNWDLERIWKIYYDTDDALWIACSLDDDNVADRETFQMKTSTNFTSWTNVPGTGGTFTSSNVNFTGAQIYKTPAGTRMLLYNWNNQPYARIFDNGWDAAHTEEWNENISDWPNAGQRYFDNIPLIDPAAAAFYFFSLSGAALYKRVWNEQTRDFSDEVAGNFEVYFNGAYRNVLPGDSPAWMIYDDTRQSFITFVANVDPANTTQVFFYEYKLQTYDPATEFALLSAPHPDGDSNIVYQVRVK
jgi:hypothetical protein